jgi:hypothetical protein
VDISRAGLSRVLKRKKERGVVRFRCKSVESLVPIIVLRALPTSLHGVIVPVVKIIFVRNGAATLLKPRGEHSIFMDSFGVGGARLAGVHDAVRQNGRELNDTVKPRANVGIDMLLEANKRILRRFPV